MDPMIRQIVGRCHVGESNREVIRYVTSRWNGGTKAFLTAPRRTRRAVMKQVVKVHAENRKLYRYVMRGF